jgi:hypothetical protein
MRPDQISSLQFPWKLHVILEQAKQRGEDSIISWLPGGKSFKVHDKIKFSSQTMPAYFNSSIYKSFQRNLNLWGFKTVTKESGKGIYYHEHFCQGQPDLCHSMARASVKQQQQQASNTNTTNSATTTTTNTPSITSARLIAAQHHAKRAEAPPPAPHCSSSSSLRESGQQHDRPPLFAASMRALEPALLQAAAVYQLQQQQEQQSQHHARMMQDATASIIALQTQVAIAQLQQQHQPPPALQVHQVEEQRRPHRPHHHHHHQHPQFPSTATATASTTALPAFLPNSNYRFMLGSDRIISRADAPVGGRTMKSIETRRREIALKGSKLIPCRARGMPLNHNNHVREQTMETLVCSFSSVF